MKYVIFSTPLFRFVSYCNSAFYMFTSPTKSIFNRVIITLILYYFLSLKFNKTNAQVYELSKKPSLLTASISLGLGTADYLLYRKHQTRDFVPLAQRKTADSFRNIYTRKAHHQFSNASLFTLYAFALSSPFYPSASQPLHLSAIHALSAFQTLAITGFIKGITHSPRPYARLMPPAYISKNPDLQTFPSGHTSLAFNLATNIYLQTKASQLKPNQALIVQMACYSLAATTGIMRITAKKHRVVDVLAGAALGTAIALLTYQLHEIH